MTVMLGLCSVSFRKHQPEDILWAMQAAGLSCIEWGSDVHAPKDDIAKLTQLAALQKEYHIRCCSYGTYFRVGVTPAEELEGYIGAAQILGADILRLWCGNKNAGDYTEEEAEQLFAECRRLAELARRHSVTLCMECHGGTYTNTKEAACRLMQAVDSQHFRMYWQPNQYKSAEENIAYAQLLSPYTLQLHVFNWKGSEKYPLQEAADTWKAYLNCFDGTQTLLLEFMPDGRLETLKTEAVALRELTQ